MKKSSLRFAVIISSFAMLFSLIACNKSDNTENNQTDTAIINENNDNETVSEEPVVEETDIEEPVVEENQVVLSLPDKYLSQLGLDSKFNDWINTERNVDDFIEIYGMPDNGDEGVYYYTNFSIFYDAESRTATRIGLAPAVLTSLGVNHYYTTPDIYNPFDLPSNLTTLKPLMDIGYLEIQNTDYCQFPSVDCIVRPTMDLKLSSSQEEFDNKYKTIFDLENDLGEAYISENYAFKATYSTSIDFSNNCYYVIWHNTMFSDNDAAERTGTIPKLIATVSMEDNSIIELSRVFELQGRNTQDDNLRCKVADEHGIEY